MNKLFVSIFALVLMTIGGAAYAHAENNARWQADWDYVDYKGQSDAVANPCLCLCVRQAKINLDGNKWHANLGDANLAAHNHRRDHIMPEFENCLTNIGDMGAGNCPNTPTWRNCE